MAVPTSGWWDKLEAITVANPPLDHAAKPLSTSLPSLSLNHPVVVLPVLKAIFLLLVHIVSPVLTVVCFLFFLKCGYFIWLSLSALFATIVFFDDMFWRGVLGWNSIVRPGLYYAPTEFNTEISKQCKILSAQPRTTWWLPTGDLCTLIPFMMFNEKPVDYKRRWMSTADGEYVALDWSFPATETANQVVLILHGLNGGSSEIYVLNLVHAINNSGGVAVVLIARGLMRTPVRYSLFHGARICDVRRAVATIRDVVGPDMFVGAVGFSMGAVILSNYVAQTGKDAGLDAAVSLGGCANTSANMDFVRSRRLWQPFLVHELKKNFIFPYLHFLDGKGLDADRALRAVDVIEFDSYVVVGLHDYRDIVDYYEDMSFNCRGKLKGICVPHLVVQAADDPIMHVDTTPVQSVQENEHLMFWITRAGGHVGWPIGNRPWKHGFSYMTDVSLGYFDAIRAARAALTKPVS